MKVGVTVEEDCISTKLDDRFGRANYFAVLELENNEIINIEFIKNTFKDEVSGAGQKLALFLKENNIEKVIVPELGPKAKIALKKLEIKAFKKNNSNYLEEAIKNIKENQLEDYALEDLCLRKV
ncbi:MAG: NifB/NifX family molybdenum-iron cluster-binding protein [Cetobacterium sp.]|uniref:NifB/NifX family molybdenum-iron cluster-binding protein n=1 Tax=Cetobacterium sp. TaxID=2071632 RepID=UPI003F32D00C